MELNNAAKDLGHVSAAFADHVESFHTKKTSDIQSALYEMIYSEMEYHAKSMEILSGLQSSICSLELEADVSEIREKIRDKTSAPN